jgi:hypothetical protein
MEEPNDTPEHGDLPGITSSTLACPGGTPHVTRSTNHFVAVIGQHQSTNEGARVIHSRQISITLEILFARNSYG